MAKPRPSDEEILQLALKEALASLNQAYELVSDNIQSPRVIRNCDMDRYSLLSIAVAHVKKAVRIKPPRAKASMHAGVQAQIS
jgi:hypothetical protein